MARLPIPGDDVGAWGGILNDFLSVELNTDGTLKKASAITTAQSTADTAQANANSRIPLSYIDTDTALTTNSDTRLSSQKAIKTYVDSTVAAGAPDANSITKGLVQLAGDLSGTATTPTVPALANKVNTSTTINGHALTGNVAISKTDVGLSNVENTSDLNKPISTATQAALNLKSPINNPTFTGAVTVPTPSNATDAVTKTYVDDAVVSGAPDATASTKGKIRLAGDISGTADVPTVPALSSKLNLSGGHVTGLLWTDSIRVGSVSAVDYVLMSDAQGNGTWKPVPSAPVTSVNAKQGVVVINKADVGLNNVDNTSDANKPINVSMQNALDLKEDKANKGVANGYAGLDGNGTIPVAQLPNQSGSYIPLTAKGVANGVAELDSNTRMPVAQLPTAIPFSNLPTGTSGSTVMIGNDSRVTNAIQNSALDTDITLAAASDLKLATQKATKTYVDNQIASGTAPDATASSKGIIQLAGDIGGTAAAPTVSASAGLKSATTVVYTGGATAPNSGQFLRASNGSNATWQAMPRTFGWYINDAIAVGDGQGPIYRLDADSTIVAFDVNAKQPPATTAQFDIQITTNPASGFSTIFSALPSITAGTFVGSNGTLSTTTLNAGVYIRFCVIATGEDGSGNNDAAGVTAQLRLQTR